MINGSNVWDKISKKYDKLWVQKYSLIPTRKKILFIIQSLNFQNFLDMGCGTGQLLGEIKSIHTESNLFGIDKSQGMISAAKSKYNDINFICIDSEDIIYNNKFDIIACCHSFPYYKNKRKVFKNVYNALNENGRAILIAASINNLYDKIIMSIIERTAEEAEYLSKKDFIHMAEELFKIEEIFVIKEKWFMPSIYGFILRKKL